MQQKELLITWLGWYIIWVYPAKVDKECIEWPSKFHLSNDHHFEVLALKSPITIEEVGIKSLISDKNKLRLQQNLSNSSQLRLGDL